MRRTLILALLIVSGVALAFVLGKKWVALNQQDLQDLAEPPLRFYSTSSGFYMSPDGTVHRVVDGVDRGPLKDSNVINSQGGKE